MYIHWHCRSILFDRIHTEEKSRKQAKNMILLRVCSIILHLPNSLFSFASSHRFTTLMTPFPATRGINNVPPMRSIFCNTFRFNSPLSLFGVVFVISWPKFDAGGILTVLVFCLFLVLRNKKVQIGSLALTKRSCTCFYEKISIAELHTIINLSNVH